MAEVFYDSRFPKSSLGTHTHCLHCSSWRRVGINQAWGGGAEVFLEPRLYWMLLCLIGHPAEPGWAVPAHRRRQRRGHGLAGVWPQAALCLSRLRCWNPSHGPVLWPEVTVESWSTHGGIRNCRGNLFKWADGWAGFWGSPVQSKRQWILGFPRYFLKSVIFFLMALLLLGKAWILQE